MTRGSAAARAAAALAVAGLLLGTWGTTASADQQSGLMLTLATRWRLAASAGLWNPYVVTVRNDGATGFDGSVVLLPNDSRNGPFSADTYPRYRSPISVPSGTERTMQVFVVDPGSGYRAELRDRQGRQVATADLDLTSRSGTVVAMLSDVTSADQRIGVPLKSLSRLDVAVTRFPSAQAFPAAVVDLTGLNGLIVDEFDSGALGPAQVQALKDFVGLGGTLIETGGASWRRTLLPLPAELLPMRPTGLASASLAPLAELGGVASDAVVQVATGELAAGARAAVSAPGGAPLVVEAPYGAGSIVELTFDPLAAPVDGQTALGALVWGQAIARGLSDARGGSQLFRLGVGPVVQGGTPAGSGPGTWAAFPGFLYQVLSDQPVAASPPFALLVVLLIVYVVLISGGCYALLRALRRRGLLWAVVPAIAVAAAAGAYFVGFGTRGSDYQQTQLQFQRLGPGGVVETYSYDGVLPPRRGDMRIDVPSGTLLSTAVLVFGSAPDAGRDTTVTFGSRPQALFANVPVWDMRPVQTLSIGHPFGEAAGTGMPIDAQLRLEGGRIKGQVVNRTSRTVRDLQVVSATGMQATLVATLAPGAAAAVDVAPAQGAPGMPMGKIAIGGAVGPVIGPGPQPPQNSRQALIALASSQAAGRAGELALIGATDPVETLRVEGAHPLRSGSAMMVEPVRLRSATALGAFAPAPRLVSTATASDGSQVDVYELTLPQGLTGRVGLNPVFAGGVQQTAAAAEIFDWDKGTWRRPAAAGASQLSAVPLSSGETSHGVVRIRVRENSIGLVQIALVDLP